MSLYAARASCQNVRSGHCMLWEHVTVGCQIIMPLYAVRISCHYDVRSCQCMLSGHHVGVCRQDTKAMYALRTPCQCMLSGHHVGVSVYAIRTLYVTVCCKNIMSLLCQHSTEKNAFDFSQTVKQNWDTDLGWIGWRKRNRQHKLGWILSEYLDKKSKDNQTYATTIFWGNVIWWMATLEGQTVRQPTWKSLVFIHFKFTKPYFCMPQIERSAIWLLLSWWAWFYRTFIISYR